MTKRNGGKGERTGDKARMGGIVKGGKTKKRGPWMISLQGAQHLKLGLLMPLLSRLSAHGTTWNDLTDDVTFSESLSSFCRQLNSYLLKKPFHQTFLGLTPSTPYL